MHPTYKSVGPVVDGPAVPRQSVSTLQRQNGSQSWFTSEKVAEVNVLEKVCTDLILLS